MNKKIIIASLLTFCAYYNSNAQMRIRKPTSGTYPASTTVESYSPGSTTNVIIGDNGSTATPSGTSLTFLGESVGANNTGSWNTFIGRITGAANTSGAANTFLGAHTGQKNQTGGLNTFVGTFVGEENISGSNNTFVGMVAGQKNTSSNNTFVGQNSGAVNTGGQGNTFVGQASGLTNVGGNNNIALGYLADFSSSSLTNAMALGYNAKVGASNSMAIGYNSSVTIPKALSIGGTDANSSAVSVGIGTPAPAADLHLYTTANNKLILEETTAPAKTSSMDLRVGTGTEGVANDLIATKYGQSITTTLLPAITSSAPAVTYGNLGFIYTKNAPLMIGLEPASGQSTGTEQDISFISNIRTAASIDPWECMRINKGNGFVGIHTRSAISSGTSGSPKALFHVNLTHAKPDIDNTTQGIRFEGLPALSGTMAPHPDALVVDADGNVARAPYTSGTGGADWLLTGNTIVGTEYIGTNNDKDFRVFTGGSIRARFTSDAAKLYSNFDFGINTFVGSSNNNGVFGTSHTLTQSEASVVTGKRNTVSESVYNVIAGETNTVQDGTRSSVISGETNMVDNGKDLAVSGASNQSNNDTRSVISGENNSLFSTQNSGAMGGTNTLNSTTGSFALGGLNTITTSTTTGSSDNSVAAGQGNLIQGASGSFAGGMTNTIKDATGAGCITIGQNNVMEGSNQSAAVGEDNHVINSHGSFVAGGHNTSTGTYNMIIGHSLKAGYTAIPPTTPLGNNIMLIGEQLCNNLQQSLAMGFHQNRTMVLTERGVAIQVMPTSSGTFAPDHNLVVDATASSGVLSNISFLNLPVSANLPVVLVDPRTGELFQSTVRYPFEVPDDSMSSMSVNNAAMNAKIEALNTAVKEQQTLIQNQQKQIDELLSLMKVNKDIAGQQNDAFNKIDIELSNKDAIVLNQNIPNPSDKNTSISYYLPARVQSASMQFSDMNGRMIKTLTLTERGKGVVNIYTSELSQGIYNYTLIADGQVVDTKKMEITR